jgi:hypothetical protein
VPDSLIPASLRSDDTLRWRARRSIGIAVFVAVDIAFLAYLLTLSSWVFLAPLATFVVAWRVAYGKWAGDASPR